MADLPLSDLGLAQAVSLSDFLVGTDDPTGVPLTRRYSIQKVVDAVALLAASGALTTSDLLPVYTSGQVSRATAQKILNVIPLLDLVANPLSGSEIVPMIQSGVAVKATIADLVEFSNTSVPTKVGWITRVAIPDGDASHQSIGEAFTLNSGTGTQSNADGNQPQGINNATTAVANNRATWGGNAIHWLTKEIRFAGMFRLMSIADISWSFYMADTFYGSWTNVDTGGGTLDWVGFRFSTSAGDTNFMRAYGTGGAGNFASTGVLADTLLHTFEVRMKANGRLDYFIDGSRVATNVNHTAATNVAMHLGAGHTTLVASAKDVRWFGAVTSQKWF